MAPHVVIVGSANMDLVGLSARLPLPGETVLGDDFMMTPGGKGANQAIAAARAGGQTVFLGAIGSDAFGVTINARLTAAGVDASGVRTSYGSSGVAVIMVDRSGENSIVVAPGANSSFTGLTESERRAIAEADVLVCQLEIPVETVTEAMRAARAAGTRTILNAAPARSLPPELLDNVDLLVVNEIEAATISGRSDIDMPALLALVPRVVLTLSGSGSRYADRSGTDAVVPAFPVEVLDTTAAGDAFTGALSVAWGEGRPLVEAVRWANAAGAACVRHVGASNALPTRDEIDALYASDPGA